MRKLPCLLAALAIALTPQAADAHYHSHGDPRDTEGGFDIARVRLRSDGRDLVGKVVGYEAAPGCCWGLTVDFGSRGDERMDLYASVDYDGASGGVYTSGLYRRGGRFVADVHARSTGDEIRIRFPERLLKATKDVRWRVELGSSGEDYTQYEDLAPGSGWYEH